MSKSGEKGNYQIQSVERAIDVLEVFSRRKPILSLPEIAEAAGLSKATTYRLLVTLQARGMISKRADNIYFCLGPAVAGLAAVRHSHAGLLDLAIAEMRLIRDALDETVSLGARNGSMRVQLHQAEGFRLPRRGSMSGDSSPLYAGASNKLLLSAMEDAEIRAYLAETELRALTPMTITDPEMLWAEVVRIRGDGFAESREEKFLGGASLAAPIRGADGQVVAALSVSVPMERFVLEHRQHCLETLLDRAGAISQELGFT